MLYFSKNNDDMVLICKLINTFINKSDKSKYYIIN